MIPIREDIKNHTFHPFYLLYGPESYLKRMYWQQLTEAILGGDTMNYHHLKERGADIRTIIETADTLPFFSEHRLIVIENCGLFKKSCKELVDYLPGMPETSILMFVEEAVDERNGLFKAVRERGVIFECARQDRKSLSSWAARILKNEGRLITGSAMDLLLDQAGDDMEFLYNELQKLISYTEGRPSVTKEDVQAVCYAPITGQIFQMAQAISAKDRKKALALYSDLLAVKEKPLNILWRLTGQFNDLFQIRSLAESGADNAAISKLLKKNQYVVARLRTQARSFPPGALEEALESCAGADAAVKSGEISDQLAVEMLLVQLSS